MANALEATFGLALAGSTPGAALSSASLGGGGLNNKQVNLAHKS
jgi:hypothetical protein